MELCAGDVSRSTDLEACHSILEHLFGHENVENNVEHAGTPQIVTNSKVLDLLKIVQSGLPYTSMDVEANVDMLKAWSHIVEISASTRISSLGEKVEVLYQIIIAALTTYHAFDEEMRAILCKVALTCMKKLREERFLFPDDNLLKRILTIFEHGSSETLRQRQYGLLLSFFQYCQHALDPDIEIDHAHFSTLRKEAQLILQIINDASHGSEKIRMVSLYVLDALVSVDDKKYYLQKLQTTGFLRNCIRSLSEQEGGYSRELLQQARTLEAKLALLLRISHKYGTSGAQVLFSMDILQHCASCRAMDIFGRTIVKPMLRLVFSLLVLIDKFEILEVKQNIVREVMNFIERHNSIFDDILFGEGDE